MSTPFSFSFTGDDIETSTAEDEQPSSRSAPAETGSLARRPNPAFPVAGQPLLPPTVHAIEEMLAALPSKISYSSLEIILDSGENIFIPRRELWDVRLQLMAEDDEVGLGQDDVKTGVYEGGFKSWESSVDLVKELAKSYRSKESAAQTILELGCGTALPSLALFQWQLSKSEHKSKFSMSFADYNPSVLRLVTLPNILLCWAQHEHGSSWEIEGDLEITEELLQKFKESIKQLNIDLHLISGAWGPDFVGHIISKFNSQTDFSLLILAAETIYSPAALQAFAATLMDILQAKASGDKSALIAAKKVYFGVGGSIEDFCEAVKARGGLVSQVREESDGVRRAVIEVTIGEST